MLDNLREMVNQQQVHEIWQGLTKTDKLNVGERERLSSLLGGGLLALYGLSRRSPSAIGFILAGGYLIYRGLSGYCPAYEALQISTAGPRLRFDEEYHDQPDGTIDAEDLYDEAVWATFPASDPPASW
jgi:uncharacterized membrane protein